MTSPWLDPRAQKVYWRNMKQTRYDNYFHQTFRVLKMDAGVPVDIRVFTQNRALRRYFAGSDGRQYTQRHGKVLVQAMASGIAPLEFRRKVERRIRFDLVAHDPEALYIIIAKRLRDQAGIAANDAERRHTAGRRDARWVATAGTKSKGSTADRDDTSGRAKAAGVKAERNRRYDNKEWLVCGKEGHKHRDCPQSQ